MPPKTLDRRRFTAALGAGLGAVLAPRPARALPHARGGTDPAPAAPIGLDSNENPYGPSPDALAAMTRSQLRASRYPDAREVQTAKALGGLHGVAPEQIVLGCGSGEILRMSDMAFLGPGRKVVVALPSFEAVLDYAKVTKAEPVQVPLTADFRHDLPRMAAACDPSVGLVYVCNPNNPTGTIVSGEELDAFFARVPRTATVILDEAYFHFVEDPRYRSGVEWLARVPNLVVVRTFSKIYGLAGMRLGYAVASKANADALRAHTIWSNANAAVLEAALVSLADEDLVARQRGLLNGTRRWLCARLQEEKRRFIPSEANFLMIDVGGDVKPVIEAFEKRGIRVGRKFPSLGTWLRVSIGTQAEIEAFLAALRDIVPASRAAA
jgi:histidinol-phosphate aminotransferase